MILFGPAGIPNSVKGKGSEAGVAEISRLGLDCMEVEFVRGVKMSDEAASRLGEAAKKAGVVLSAHAPYYVNLCSLEPEKTRAGLERIYQTARKCRLFGGKKAVFHAAFYQGRDEKLILDEVAARLLDLRKKLDREGNEVVLAPELTGKPSQFGSLRELIRLSGKVPGVAPCVDFAHLVARASGEGNDYESFAAAIKTLKKGLGAGAMKDLHMHVSGIEWTGKGELRHLKLEESKLDWRSLVLALIDAKVGGIMICESPAMEEDALLLKNFYSTVGRSRKANGPGDAKA